MSDSRQLVRNRTVQIEAKLAALGAAGTGLSAQVGSLAARLPEPLQRDLRQVGYIQNRVLQGGFELDGVDAERFHLLTDRVLRGLSDVQEQAGASGGRWAPPADQQPIWIYFAEPVLRRYADFSGRTRRRDYWGFTLIHGAIAFVLLLLSAMTGGFPDDDLGSPSPLGHLFYFLLGLYLIATFIPHLAIMVRRLHDQGSSGWLVACNFVGLGVIVLILTALDSKPGTNKWGPNPKGVEGPVNAF